MASIEERSAIDCGDPADRLTDDLDELKSSVRRAAGAAGSPHVDDLVHLVEAILDRADDQGGFVLNITALSTAIGRGRRYTSSLLAELTSLLPGAVSPGLLALD